MQTATQPLPVQVGDTVVVVGRRVTSRSPSVRRLAVVEKRTAKTITAGAPFNLDGTCRMRGLRISIRLPEPGEVEELRAAEQAAREQALAELAERERFDATPEARARRAIVGAMDSLTDREAVERFGTRLIDAAAALGLTARPAD